MKKIVHATDNDSFWNLFQELLDNAGITFGISAAFLAKIGDLDPKVITIVISNMGLKRCLHKMYSLNIRTHFLPVLLFGSILQILSGLYIGNFRDSKDLKQLDLHKITHILSVHDEARKLFKVGIKDEDTRGKSLLELWRTTFLPDWQPPLIFV